MEKDIFILTIFQNKYINSLLIFISAIIYSLFFLHYKYEICALIKVIPNLIIIFYIMYHINIHEKYAIIFILFIIGDFLMINSDLDFDIFTILSMFAFILGILIFDGTLTYNNSFKEFKSIIEYISYSLCLFNFIILLSYNEDYLFDILTLFYSFVLIKLHNKAFKCFIVNNDKVYYGVILYILSDFILLWNTLLFNSIILQYASINLYFGSLIFFMLHL
jgi:hypothetical protein